MSNMVTCPSCGHSFRRPKGLKALTASKLILGEGRDEVNVFQSVLTYVGNTGVVCEDYEGKTQLVAALPQLTKRSGFNNLQRLLITRDADEDPEGAFRSVQSSLSVAGLPVPQRPLEWAVGTPEVCVAILPLSGSRGALETDCIASLGLLSRIRIRLFLSPRAEKRLGFGGYLKAQVYSHLSREDPDARRAGEAALRGVWNWDHPAFKDLLSLLKSI